MAFITLEYCYYLWHRYLLSCLCNVRCEMWWYQTDLLHLDIPNPNTTRFLPHVFPPPCLHLVLVAHIVKVLQNFLPAYIPTANCIVQWQRLLKMLNGSLQSVVCCAGIGDSIRYWLLAQLAGHAALLHKSPESHLGSSSCRPLPLIWCGSSKSAIAFVLLCKIKHFLRLIARHPAELKRGPVAPRLGLDEPRNPAPTKIECQHINYVKHVRWSNSMNTAPGTTRHAAWRMLKIIHW